MSMDAMHIGKSLVGMRNDICPAARAKVNIHKRFGF